MSSYYKTKNSSGTSTRMIGRERWQATAYILPLGPKMVKDFHFVERLHYGVIDHKNNSVIPNDSFLVPVGDFRLFDFVADSYSLAKLNCVAAINNGMMSEESFFVNFDIKSAYTDPKLKYGRYLDDIFQFYNETHIPSIIGKLSIASYDDYVKHFFNFFLETEKIPHLTMTSWNVSNRSSILDTGIAISVLDLPVDEDQRKMDEIIKTAEFEYYKNLTLNMGFSINHNNPNVLVYDLNSPAGRTIRNSYNLGSLESIFNSRFIKTYTLDFNLIYNKLIIFYNKYVNENPFIRDVKIHGCQTVSEYILPERYDGVQKTYSDEDELMLYIKIRNKEENNVFSLRKLDDIYKKSIYFMKKVDKPRAMSYINSMFRDQVWNKNNGYHDLKAKLENRTTTEAQRQQTVGTSYSTSGGSSGGSSY